MSGAALSVLRFGIGRLGHRGQTLGCSLEVVTRRLAWSGFLKVVQGPELEDPGQLVQGGAGLEEELGVG